MGRRWRRETGGRCTTAGHHSWFSRQECRRHHFSEQNTNIQQHSKNPQLPRDNGKDCNKAITDHQQSQRIRARKDGEWIGVKVGPGVDGEPRQALREVDKWCRRERKKECWRKEEKGGSYGSGSLVRKEGALGRRHREHGRRVCLSGRGGEDHIISKFIATATTNLLRGHRAYPPPAYWTTASSDRVPVHIGKRAKLGEPTAEPAIISLMSQERPGWKAPILDHFLRPSALPMRCGA